MLPRLSKDSMHLYYILLEERFQTFPSHDPSPPVFIRKQHAYPGPPKRRKSKTLTDDTLHNGSQGSKNKEENLKDHVSVVGDAHEEVL